MQKYFILVIIECHICYNPVTKSQKGSKWKYYSQEGQQQNFQCECKKKIFYFYYPIFII